MSDSFKQAATDLRNAAADLDSVRDAKSRAAVISPHADTNREALEAAKAWKSKPSKQSRS